MSDNNVAAQQFEIALSKGQTALIAVYNTRIAELKQQPAVVEYLAKTEFVHNICVVAIQDSGLPLDLHFELSRDLTKLTANKGAAQ